MKLSSLVLALLVFVAPDAVWAAQAHPNEPFRKLAIRLAQQRLDAVEEKRELQEQALVMLDEFALGALNAPAFKLDAVNQQLAAWVTQTPPVGENYRLVGLTASASPAAGDTFLLVANFGLSGPSAVRIYSRSGGAYKLAARIDRFTQPDLFDEYLELLPISADGVFVTVTGRTDELETGGFTAWRFDGREVRPLWASDLLQQSKYELAGGELRLTFCSETDEDRPRVCQKMLRETYRWSGGLWRRTSQDEVPVPKKEPADSVEETYEVVPSGPSFKTPLLREPPELRHPAGQTQAAAPERGLAAPDCRLAPRQVRNMPTPAFLHSAHACESIASLSEDFAGRASRPRTSAGGSWPKSFWCATT